MAYLPGCEGCWVVLPSLTVSLIQQWKEFPLLLKYFEVKMISEHSFHTHIAPAKGEKSE